MILIFFQKKVTFIFFRVKRMKFAKQETQIKTAEKSWLLQIQFGGEFGLVGC